MHFCYHKEPNQCVYHDRCGKLTHFVMSPLVDQLVQQTKYSLLLTLHDCLLVLQVPFVNVIDSLSDSSLYLTAKDYKEFGNPQ